MEQTVRKTHTKNKTKQHFSETPYDTGRIIKSAWGQIIDTRLSKHLRVLHPQECAYQISILYLYRLKVSDMGQV